MLSTIWSLAIFLFYKKESSSQTRFGKDLNLASERGRRGEAEENQTEVRAQFLDEIMMDRIVARRRTEAKYLACHWSAILC